MEASILRSPSVARALIVALGLAVLIQLLPGYLWDWPRWATTVALVLASVAVFAPIALTFLASKLCTRDDARSAWWRIVPLLFAPWILATCLQVPYSVAGFTSTARETLISIDSFAGNAFRLGLLVATFTVIYACYRSHVLTRDGRLAALSLAIFALTAIGGWFVMMVGILS